MSALMRQRECLARAAEIAAQYEIYVVKLGPGPFYDNIYHNLWQQAHAELGREGQSSESRILHEFRDCLRTGHKLPESLSEWPDPYRDDVLRLIWVFTRFELSEEYKQPSENIHALLSSFVADFDRRMEFFFTTTNSFPWEVQKVFSMKEETGREDESLATQLFIAEHVKIAATLDDQEKRIAKLLTFLQEIVADGSTFKKQIYQYIRIALRKEPGYLTELEQFFGRVLNADNLPEVYRSYVRQNILGYWAGVGGGGDVSALSDQPKPYSVPLGVNDAGTMVYYGGGLSLVTIAPPGSGKTLCHAIPTLRHYRGPAIILDIKGDCHTHSAAWREENVGPVLTFNPVNPDRSSRYNPLAFISEEADLIWEDSRLMADLLITPSKASDPTWERLGKDLLTLILAVVTMTEPLVTRTMTRVLDYVATIGLAEMLSAVAETRSPFPDAARRTAARFSQMSSNAAKQFEGVLGGITQQLHLWEGPRIEKVTSGCEWTPEDLRVPPFKTLYLNVPPDAIGTYAPLLRVIVGQHVRRLMQGADTDEPPILFMLDELPQLGYMEPIRKALEVGRSYGIKLWMICQYREQLLEAYPGVADGMIGSCGVQLYMNPRHTAAERISREFGETKGLFEKERKPLLDPVELTGPKYKDSIFVRVAGEEGMVLRKKFFDASSSGE